MDGEVNNRTARITQDVKRDETDAGDRQTHNTTHITHITSITGITGLKKHWKTYNTDGRRR